MRKVARKAKVKKPLVVCMAVMFVLYLVGLGLWTNGYGERLTYARVLFNLTGGGMSDTSLELTGDMMVNNVLHSKQQFRATVMSTSLQSPAQGDPQGRRLRIAILIPTTSRHIRTGRFFKQSSLTTLAMPSLDRTMETSKYNYTIYLGIDQGDALEKVQSELRSFSKYILPVVVPSTNFRECVNAIAKKAFDDGADYFVRINDDTVMVTYNWTTLGIKTLQSYTPPNVGMVGPTCKQGNQLVMTHDMVHRSHMQIFSHYYPLEFTDWWADDWIDIVYRPTRSTKLINWIVVHKRIHGRRYWVNKEREFRMKLMDSVDKPKIFGFAFPKRRVVSYSLYGSDKRYIDGALANAALMETVYPEWVMRIYHDSTVSGKVLDKLGKYCHVHLINMPEISIHKNMWRFLVAADSEVEAFVVRDVYARLNAREKSAVDDWLKTDKQFHVMRDHPYQSHRPMSAGLWGGRKLAIPNIGQLVLEINMDSVKDGYALFMEYVIWPMAQRSVLQHDSFSCDAYGSAIPFPTPRNGTEFVGSKLIKGKVDEKLLNALKNKANKCK